MPPTSPPATRWRRVGLTRSTTIDVIDELVRRGLLRELPNARAGGEYRKGRPSRRFELRADAGAVVGIDAGRGHLIATVADLRGATLVRTQPRPRLPRTTLPTRAARCAAAALDGALEAAGLTRADVIALCIGVPAPVDAAGTSPPHRDGFWRRMNPGFIADFAEPIPLVRVENDAYLAAVAERAIGCRRGLRRLRGRCWPASDSAPASPWTAGSCAAPTAASPRWSPSTA